MSYFPLHQDQRDRFAFTIEMRDVMDESSEIAAEACDHSKPENAMKSVMCLYRALEEDSRFQAEMAALILAADDEIKRLRVAIEALR